ncbi:hypothetical protein V2M10_10650, partial [Streptococcus pneumoniae]
VNMLKLIVAFCVFALAVSHGSIAAGEERAAHHRLIKRNDGADGVVVSTESNKPGTGADVDFAAQRSGTSHGCSEPMTEYGTEDFCLKKCLVDCAECGGFKKCKQIVNSHGDVKFQCRCHFMS